MSPKISLIIPIYNAARYLKECLDSVTAQTIFSNVQVLLVNDGSTDDSPKICAAFAEQYENITVIRQENSGVSVARNRGLTEAKGEYIAFADADDLLYPEMLERLYTVCKNTGAEMSFCAFEHPYPDKTVYITYPFPEEKALDQAAIRTAVADFMIRDEAFNALWNKLFLRSVIEDNQIRMTQGKKYAEDREFVLRFLAFAKRICYTPYIGYYYRYVETGAIQKPRLDYGVRIVEQFEDDCKKFAALGMDRAQFSHKAAYCTAGKIVGAVSFAENKLSGKVRRAVLRSILNDRQLQDILSALWDDIAPTQTKFNVYVLRAIRRKSVWQVRAVLLAMRIKVALYQKLRGGTSNG